MSIQLIPLLSPGLIQTIISCVVFIAIGFCFGFVLERVGLTNSRNIAGVFYGYDTRVLKVFFTAAVVAAIGIASLQYTSILNAQTITWHPLFIWGILIGALIMGVGFALGGFCPGTSPCAAATGKIDAMIYLVGLFIGIIIFSHGFPYWEYAFNYSLGIVHIHDLLAIPKHWFLVIFSIVAALSFWLAEYIEKRITNQKTSVWPRIIASLVLIAGAATTFFIC
ncbi:MAG: hypothetical protein A2Y40_01750 [Candidatus Margulisbacteria bacterium GWF2_35_9]|nr:MAG: hypothetical protein A2Y40_01750 [Candidatus Margulisbacteria bacterium GWF2_35_9]